MRYKILCFVLFPIMALSQNVITGTIYETDSNNNRLPLPGANVYWLDTTVGAVTDIDGEFKLPYNESYKKLVISFVGYTTDTLTVNSLKPIQHSLKPSSALDAVTVNSRKQTTVKSYMQAANVIKVSSEELLKAACCNLSESFETNPSIDVNFADAISGTRQIKMLGLTNPYILIATENIPSVRGASQAYGLTFTPGTWVESIQITKGTGSVVNGFESIAGQINAELVKPTTDHKLFVNAYAATSERMELNTHFNTKLNDRWATGIYLHGNTHQQEHDVNNDGFLDMPKYHQINLMNRWQYTDTEKGFVSFLNLRYLTDKKQAGQVNFNPDNFNRNNLLLLSQAGVFSGVGSLSGVEAWGSEINTDRIDISTKFGYVNPNVPWQSIGVQAAYSNHKQESYFGLRQYNITHNSWYANAIYNSIIGDSRSKIKTGLSFTYDKYDEIVDLTIGNTNVFKRVENDLGAFFEYAFDNQDTFSLTAGVRVDNHNLLGFFVTPRLHLRYSPWAKSAFRASVGRGKRSANIFTENQSMFASSREVAIVNANGPVYGLDPEIAWNYGVSYLQGFTMFGRKGDITFDFYRTDFQNQVVVDYENPTQTRFYNLEGDSYANSFQTEINYSPFKHFTTRLAYKYYDVQTNYLEGKRARPLTPKHRFFANVGWESHVDVEQGDVKQWKIDATFNWLSEQRFSDTFASPIQYQQPSESPTIGTLNAQITRVFSPKFEVYLGGENITNVRQPNPIVNSENPFGPYFDTTFVYGPIFGSMYYAGLRYKLK